MSNAVEKETNKLAEVKWTDNGVLVATFPDGFTEKLDPRLCSQSVRATAEQYGFGVRFQRLGSLEVKDYPTVQLRREEYRRRWRELREHYYSGTDAWDIPKTRAASGPSEADLTEVLDRYRPGKGQGLLTALIAKNGGDLPKTREAILATKELAEIWVKIQNERRLARTEGLAAKAEDLLAGLEGV